MANENIWPIDRWGEALEIWSQNELFVESWNGLSNKLTFATNDFLLGIIHPLCWWLESVAKTFQRSELDFFSLCTNIHIHYLVLRQRYINKFTINIIEENIYQL